MYCDVQMCNVCTALADSWVAHHELMCALEETSVCACVPIMTAGPSELRCHYVGPTKFSQKILPQILGPGVLIIINLKNDRPGDDDTLRSV